MASTGDDAMPRGAAESGAGGLGATSATDEGSALVEPDEREALISQLEETQRAFERRALSAMAEPLISTPLTMQQLKVLAMIALDADGATGVALAALAGVSVPSMSAMIDRLVDHGMVQRSEDPLDRRVRRLRVTPEGHEVIRSLLSAAGTIPAPVLRRIALPDLRALVQGVRAVDRASVGEPDGD